MQFTVRYKMWGLICQCENAFRSYDLMTNMYICADLNQTNWNGWLLLLFALIEILNFMFDMSLQKMYKYNHHKFDLKSKLKQNAIVFYVHTF